MKKGLLQKIKSIPNEMLSKGWYMGLYAGSDTFTAVKYWNGERWNDTQYPSCECDVHFVPKVKMEVKEKIN